MFPALRKLLPTGRAWLAPSESKLRSLLDGLSDVLYDLIDFSGQAFLDLLPETTRELDMWESELGAFPRVRTEEQQRALIAFLHQDVGNQSVYAMQQTIRAFGFPNLIVHSCWADETARTLIDPRTHTNRPRIGTYRCGDGTSTCGSGARCNLFLCNEPYYWNHLEWRNEAPPVIPDDPAYWPYFIYVSADPFGTPLQVRESDWRMLQWIIERTKPARHWVVIFAVVVPDHDFRIFDDTFATEFE